MTDELIKRLLLGQTCNTCGFNDEGQDCRFRKSEYDICRLYVACENYSSFWDFVKNLMVTDDEIILSKEIKKFQKINNL